MQSLRAIMRLTRVESSFIGFLAIFLPFLVRTGDLYLSFGKSIPLLFISMCTYIANDLNDVERDQINHPERPLPAGHLSPTIATLLYFIFLGSALFSTRHYVPPRVSFWYYALIILSLSYSYIVEYLPSIKAIYVAAVTTIPVLIVAVSFPGEARLHTVAGSVLFYTMGKEICMDIRDRVGDVVSFLHRFRPNSLASVAFSLQLTGLLLLATESRYLDYLVDLMAMVILLVIASILWFKFADYQRAIMAMRCQLLLGLYFLI